jgi:hypothetical protein
MRAEDLRDLKSKAEIDHGQHYTDCLGSALQLFYKLRPVSEELDRQIQGLLGRVSGSKGPVGFSGGVHLIEVLDSVQHLKQRIEEQKVYLYRLQTFDPQAAFDEVNKIVMEYV